MQSNEPLVTIGITCFNAEDTIESAIKSAATQTYTNTEILIVDDGSMDNSVLIINRLASQNKKIVFIKHTKNQGFGGALNTIIDHSNGDYIAIFDDDDISHENRVKIQLKTLRDFEKKSQHSLAACWCSGYKSYPNGYKYHFKAIGSRPSIPNGEKFVKSLLYMGSDKNVFFGAGTPSCSLMVKKSVYEIIGGYDINLRRNEDTDFAVRLALAGGYFIGTEEELIFQTASVGSDKNPSVSLLSELSLIKKYKHLFSPEKRFLYAKDWIMLRYLHFSGFHFRKTWHLLLLFVKYPAWTFDQFFRNAPKRIMHEIKMAKK